MLRGGVMREKAIIVVVVVVVVERVEADLSRI